MYKKLDVPPPVALTEEHFHALQRIGLEVRSRGAGYVVAFPENVGDNGSFEVLDVDLEKKTVTYTVKFYGEPWAVMVWALHASAQPMTWILHHPIGVVMF